MSFASAVVVTPIPLTPLAAVNATLPVTPDGTNGNRFIVNSRTILRVANSNGSTRTVTVHLNRMIDGQAVPNDTFVVPITSGDVLYTGFTSNNWMNEAQEAWVEFSAVSGLTMAVYQPD